MGLGRFGLGCCKDNILDVVYISCGERIGGATDQGGGGRPVFPSPSDPVNTTLFDERFPETSPAILNDSANVDVYFPANVGEFYARCRVSYNGARNIVCDWELLDFSDDSVVDSVQIVLSTPGRREVSVLFSADGRFAAPLSCVADVRIGGDFHENNPPAPVGTTSFQAFSYNGRPSAAGLNGSSVSHSWSAGDAPTKYTLEPTGSQLGDNGFDIHGNIIGIDASVPGSFGATPTIYSSVHLIPDTRLRHPIYVDDFIIVCEFTVAGPPDPNPTINSSQTIDFDFFDEGDVNISAGAFARNRNQDLVSQTSYQLEDLGFGQTISLRRFGSGQGETVDVGVGAPLSGWSDGDTFRIEISTDTYAEPFSQIRNIVYQNGIEISNVVRDTGPFTSSVNPQMSIQIRQDIGTESGVVLGLYDFSLSLTYV